MNSPSFFTQYQKMAASQHDPLSSTVQAQRDHWIAECNALRQENAELRHALKDMLDQMGNPANAHHTLFAYMHGVCVANARAALARKS